MRYQFATPEPPKLRAGIAAGSIEIETADVAETIVEVEAIRGDVDNLKVEQHGRDVVIEHRRRFALSGKDEYEIRITAPHGADADLNVASADVRAAGRYGEVELHTASGDLRVAEVERDAKVRSASGDVRFDTVRGRIEVTTASGDLEIGAAHGGGTIRSASGDVRLGQAADRVVVQTASGDLVIESIAEGAVDLKSASGDARIGVGRGSRLYVDARSLSGDTSSEVDLDGVEADDEGPLVEVKASSMSGDIRIVRA
ncbi:MAG TPA: DUF4097 family beta strand repeat-containing protein [Gaiellaceae bacterium]|nr:DUF4097 family beta strand repeat-containing protein [Gaiellaceae bacterium]